MTATPIPLLQHMPQLSVNRSLYLPLNWQRYVLSYQLPPCFYLMQAGGHNNHIVALGTVCCGVGPGGSTAMLARVSLVRFRGDVLLDVYVRPTMPVTDYRTAITGIEAGHLNSEQAVPFNVVQSLVAEAIKGKILIGHAIWNDLSVLGIPHPAVATRDVALYHPFKNALQASNQLVGLQTLSWHLMRRRIQYGKLDSVENARAALDLYRSDALEWEKAIQSATWPCALPPSTHSRCYC